MDMSVCGATLSRQSIAMNSYYSESCREVRTPILKDIKLNVQQIISQIDQEIASLTKVKEALQGTPSKRGPHSTTVAKSVTKKKAGRRKMSAETKARMAAAQKARWAKLKGKKV